MSEIIHVDLDGFFIAVERQLDPRLAQRPVVIGGQPSTHGVVVAACAEAARCGVRPGLSLAIAAARCPDAAFLDGAVERYLEASAAVDEILRDPHLTGAGAAVEWTAIDSVFIAVGNTTGVVSASGGAPAAAAGDGLRVAERLRERLQRELGFEVSCGVARSRAAAQIASRISRPRGVLYALPGYEARLLAPLDVGLLPDLPVGARQRLVMESIMTLGDLAGVSDERAKALLGTRGPTFVRWARGEDDRPIDRSQPPRSIAREVTLTHPDAPEAELADVVRHLADVLAMRLRTMGWFARTVTLRLRPALAPADPPANAPAAASRPQPNRLVRSVTLREATALDEDLRAAAASLLKVLWRRQPVGGLGLVLSNLQPTGPQMPLFPLARPEAASATADTLRVRSGLRVLVDQRYASAGRRYAGRRHGQALAQPARAKGDRYVEQPLPLRQRRTG